MLGRTRGHAIRFAALLLAGGLLGAAAAGAEVASWSGRIHLGKGVWGTPAEAREKGLFFYRDRWLEQKLKPKLEAWEKQDSKSADWKSAYRTESKHYRITTNLPRYIVELEIKPFLDQLYRTYVRVFKQDYGLSSRAANRHSIKIYHGLRPFLEHEQADRSSPGYIAGDELVTFYEEADPGEFYNTVFHEGAHQFFAALLPGANLPTWLDEALATYFEGCTYSRSTGEIGGPFVPPDRLSWAKKLIDEAARSGPVSPQDLFMGVDYNHFEAEHYALSWSFVHYLVNREGGKKRARFAKFLKAMNGSGNKPIEEVFRKATRERLDQVGQGWVEYVRALEEPPAPEWIFLAVSGADGLDLLDDDVIWSIDGIRIYTGSQFEQLWTQRDPGRETALRLVRRSGDGYRYETRFVDVTLAANGGVSLRMDARLPRSANLVD